MNIEEHMKNLKKYIEEDFAFREPIKNMSDFDKYCWNHCKDIETLLTAYEKEKEKNKELEDTLRCTQNSWYEDTKVIIDKDKIIEELKKYKK